MSKWTVEATCGAIAIINDMNNANANQRTPAADRRTGIVIVDHGSRREASNRMLLEIVHTFRQVSDYRIVQPAHMELAEPTIQQAFDACVTAGARRVVVHPYFLLPGRHWDRDIPTLVREAAGRHRGVDYLITAPLGQHPLIQQVMLARISECLAHALQQGAACMLCQDDDTKCRFQSLSRER